jgi:hypothetical protein
MPRYKVTLTDGRTFVVEADSQPSEADVLASLRRSGDKPAESQPAEPTSTAPAASGSWSEQMLDKALGAVKDVGVGALKGAGETVKSLADLGRRHVPGFAALDKAGSIQIGDTLESANAAQSIGKGAERVAEFAVPSMAAGKVMPLARGAGALRLGGRMALEGAGAAPLAALHGESPVAAGVTAAAMPGVAQGATALGRAAIGKIAKPGAALVKSMTGLDDAAKLDKITDTIIGRNVTGPGKAQKLIDEEGRVVAALRQGPEGRTVTRAQQTVPESLARQRTFYKEAPINEQELQATDDVLGRLLSEEAPMGKPTVTGQKQVPTGLLDASGKPLMRTEEVTGRVLRDDITMDEALGMAQRQRAIRGNAPFAERGSATAQGSKAVEMGLREAAADAVPALRGPQGRISELLDAKKALERKGPMMDPTDLAAASGSKTGLVLKMLRTLGIPIGIGTAKGGQALEREALIRALMTGGVSGLSGGRE